MPGMPLYDQTTSKVKFTAIIIALLAIGCGSFVGYYITCSITVPLLKITDAAQAISTGDVNQRIQHQSSDELGKLAQSFRSLIDYIKELAGVADAMGLGNMSVQVKVRSEKDVLSKSSRPPCARWWRPFARISADSNRELWKWKGCWRWANLLTWQCRNCRRSRKFWDGSRFDPPFQGCRELRS
jgi:HAMP domain-containing protein